MTLAPYQLAIWATKEKTMNGNLSLRSTKDVPAVKRFVGEIAAITVDLVAQGVAVYRVGDTCGGEDLLASEKEMWLVSALSNSPLADKVLDIPLASSQAEAWALAIQALATDRDVSADLRAGSKPVRRTIRKLWRDMREYASYGLYCEMHASEHFDQRLTAWDRFVCWLGGAATGYFNDDCWMPISWRLMGRSPAEWNAFVQSTWDNVDRAPCWQKVPSEK
jgi:hypothetical protein